MTCEPGQRRISEWLRPLRFGTGRVASCEWSANKPETHRRSVPPEAAR
jgi:hypothetical protein